ncbi:TIGR01457 family HAD-type hydrolase [Alteribacillus bidgolensis]|uniref:4-nitrophenyl phosphatase n=1 Tax=Alteribacillus bidgolensis TaxID=930129 RepID=A0A1G8EIT2_9BACI|nr:TIGR01457 family HAD-type hydrolase [Alteribacillus bidgolensis]SDH69756.1 4-nitrophenyl phosphatase [Alteribacillus bidgolensis]
MKKYNGYLLDLDGTIYKGKEPIPEAVAFIQKLHDQQIPYLFVTNNSTTSPEKVAVRIRDMGIPCEEKYVLTTSMAAASYITTNPYKQTAYIIGEDGLKEQIRSAGIQEDDEEPGFVVVGLDRQVTYDKLAKACLAVRNGAHFVSTNADNALPTEKGLMPGNGAITSIITVSTGVEPTFIGKPERIMIDQAVNMLGVSPENTVLIGDNYDTDILAGIQAGLDTIHVETGVTSSKEAALKSIPATYSISSLSEWNI